MGRAAPSYGRTLGSPPTTEVGPDGAAVLCHKGKRGGTPSEPPKNRGETTQECRWSSGWGKPSFPRHATPRGRRFPNNPRQGGAAQRPLVPHWSSLPTSGIVLMQAEGPGARRGAAAPPSWSCRLPHQAGGRNQILAGCVRARMEANLGLGGPSPKHSRR